MTRRSIALRLALMYALAAVAGFVLIGTALHQVLERELARHQREQVEGRLQDVRYMLEHGRSPQLAARVREKIDTLTGTDEHVRFWLWSPDPAWRYGKDAEQVRQATAGRNEVVNLPLGPGGQPMGVLGTVLAANERRPEVELMAGTDAESFGRTLRAFESALAVLTLTGALLVALMGYWIARVGLRPVRQLSADAQRIGPDNRGQRLQLPSLPLELSDLGSSFNAALDRLDGAYQQLETFNADVAHELRTPLANLIGQTQVALARERDAPQLREVLQSNLEEAERLRAIVADMLFLARAEQGARAQRVAEASLAAEVGKTAEFFEMLLDDAHMRIRVEGDARVPIETSLFRRALSNLLHNAIQHSRPGAEIVARIEPQPGGALVAFSNPSDTIPPEQLARLFDRFYRADLSRAHSDENHGLGLAIVKAVALMHGGSVFARSEDGVTTVGFSVAETAGAESPVSPP